MNSILEVDINAILHNLKILSKNKEVLIPVKANAYGTGYDIIDELIKENYINYGVSTIEEAIYLREKNKNINILLLSSLFEDDLDSVYKNNITVTVYDFDILNKIDTEVNIHLKFDLGMGRLGFLPEDKKEVLDIIKKRNLTIQGIYTHLPDTSNSKQTEEEILEFKKIVDFLKKEIDIKYVHMFNGVGALKYKEEFDNLIRPGLVTYGYLPNKQLKDELGQDIKESLKLKTKIGHKKNYKGYIGYDSIDYVDGEILTLPIGYHDGIKMSFRGYEIKDVGKVVGKPCMCQTMILSKNKKLKKGDFVEIFNKTSMYELSEYSEVSIYEIISTMSNRIKREYIKGEQC